MSWSDLDWLKTGKVRIACRDLPLMEFSLSKAYYSADFAFAETSLETSDSGFSLHIDLHPKIEWLHLLRLEIEWPFEHIALSSLDVTPESYRGFILPGRGRDERMLCWSLDESLAFTYFSTSTANQLKIERNFGGLSFRHTTPVLQLQIGPVQQIIGQYADRVSFAATRTLCLGADWLSWPSKNLMKFLGASWLEELRIQRVQVDARLSLGAFGLPSSVTGQLAAFAKTCASLDLEPSVSVAPFLWSPRGISPSCAPAVTNRSAEPEWFNAGVDSKRKASGRWSPVLGDYCFAIEELNLETDRAISQLIIWLRNMGYRHFELLESSALANPEQRSSGSNVKVLSSGLRLVHDAAPDITLSAADLPEDYLIDYGAQLHSSAAHRFWRKPYFGYWPHRETSRASLTPSLGLIRSELMWERRLQSLSKHLLQSEVYEIRLSAKHTSSDLQGGPTTISEDFWVDLEVQLQAQLTE